MGTVQTLVCSRDGDICWKKLVYIPTEEKDQAYKEFLMKRHGCFFYDFIGEIKAVSRKPRHVALWNS